MGVEVDAFGAMESGGVKSVDGKVGCFVGRFGMQVAGSVKTHIEIASVPLFPDGIPSPSPRPISMRFR